MLTTPLCRTLGIEAPVLSVGFGAGAGAELAAAVSNAGGLGVLGLASALPEEARLVVGATRALTERPFGANILLVNESSAEVVETCLELGVSTLVFFWGDVDPYVESAHAAGARVLVQVGSVDEARQAAAAGADAVIAQGFEAGGHVRGTTALSVLVPAVADAVSPVPVGASGGIADGRGLAAALVLGAQIVSLGTRFVASTQAYVPEGWKTRLAAATADDTLYTDQLFSRNWPAPHRVLRNDIVRGWEAGRREDGTIGELVRSTGERYEIRRYTAFMATPDFHGDLEQAPLWTGQSVELVHEVKDAGDIVRDLVAEAEAALYSTTTYSNAAQQSSAKSKS